MLCPIPCLLWSPFWPRIQNTLQSPLLWDQSSIVDRIAAHKMKPGARFYDSTINSNGYHDTEFFVANDSDFVIGMLAEYFDENKIHYLDLFPVLKSKQESGRTYHLQDTHWNARGNKVAGEEIAKFVLDLGK